MLTSLKSKYRSLFPSIVDLHKKGLVLSDDVIEDLVNNSHPLPTTIPNFTIGYKVGEGLTSETYYFPHSLAPFQLVVQFHPLETQDTNNLIIVSSLISQLYALTPHITPFLGYYLASSGEAKVFQEQTTSSPQDITLDSDSYGLIYQKVSGVFNTIPKFNYEKQEHRYFFSQLMFSIELLHRCGFVHGDINPGNLAWETKPEWQGKSLLSYKYYGYIIGDQTYYLPACPVLRILDYNLSSYDDNELVIRQKQDPEIDIRGILVFIMLCFPQIEYQEIEKIMRNRESTTFWREVFGSYFPQPGDKVIILGNIPD